MKALYRTEVTASGGRRGGTAVSSDDRLTVSLSMPTELGGDGGYGTNPEQLFAAGYASCFRSALNVAARRLKVHCGDPTVRVRVGVGPEDDGTWALELAIHVSIPVADHGTAGQMVEVANAICPYSKAVRGNIPIELTYSSGRDLSPSDVPDGGRRGP